MRVYYNDNDAFACAWLEELIANNAIPDGDVDNRPIEDVPPGDLKTYDQCHFFAGIGGWAYALRLAHFERPCWTGSCPCQPWSGAGKRQGHADTRHVWPAFRWLIEQCRPAIVMGEQTAGAEVVGTKLETSFIIAVQSGDYAAANRIAHALFRSSALHYYPRWIDGVQTDLAALDYTSGIAVLGAHSVQAPHIRQRLFWLAHDNRTRRPEAMRRERKHQWNKPEPRRRIVADGLADARHKERGARPKSGRCNRPKQGRQEPHEQPCTRRAIRPCEYCGYPFDHELLGKYGCPNCCGEGLDGLADAEYDGPQGRVEAWPTPAPIDRDAMSHWRDSVPVQCRDGKYRRIPLEPALCPLAYGIPNRMGALRGAGNAIVPQVAAAFIAAAIEDIEAANG